MESLFIKDFRRGLDTRRSELTQQPGTLEVLTNGFVNQGGEIENRKAFVRTAQIANSYGLQTTSSGLLTFGSATAPGGYPLNIGTVGIPIYVNYQQLKHPQDMFDGTTDVVPMTEVVHSTEFRGKAWVVAKFGSSGTFGYYDGTLVYDFTNGVVYSFLSTNAKIAQFIEQMIDRTTGYTAATASNVVTVTGQPGQPFSTAAAETTAGNGTLDALALSQPTEPVAAKMAIGSFEVVAGTSAAGTNKITKVEVNGVEITNPAADIDWTVSNEATATALAANISSYASTPEYTAEANGAVVTIKAAASDGDTPNNYVVSVTCAGNVCIGKVQFQILNSLGAGFACDHVYVKGADILSASVPWASTTSVLATDIAANINAGTGTHGYVCCAIGSNFFLSKAVTRSDDPYLPVFVVTNPTPTSGNGIFEVGSSTGGTGGVSAVLVVTGVAIVGSGNAGSKRWRYFLALTITGGVAPYQSPVWYGGTVTAIDATHYTTDIVAPVPQPPAPHVYAKVTDSLLQTAYSNTL